MLCCPNLIHKSIVQKPSTIHVDQMNLYKPRAPFMLIVIGNSHGRINPLICRPLELSKLILVGCYFLFVALFIGSISLCND